MVASAEVVRSRGPGNATSERVPFVLHPISVPVGVGPARTPDPDGRGGTRQPRAAAPPAELLPGFTTGPSALGPVVEVVLEAARGQPEDFELALTLC